MAAQHTLTHSALTNLVEAGAVRAAHVVGQKGGWAVLVKFGRDERVLAAERSKQVRIFRKFETLTAYLKEVGIVRFDVDAANFDPVGLRASRPDRAEAMRKAHEASEHDRWFRKEVEASLANPNPSYRGAGEVFDDLKKYAVELAAQRGGH